MALALRPQVVFQAPQHSTQIFRDASHLWWLLCPLVCLRGRLPCLRHVLLYELPSSKALKQLTTIACLFVRRCVITTQPRFHFCTQQADRGLLVMLGLCKQLRARSVLAMLSVLQTTDVL